MNQCGAAPPHASQSGTRHRKSDKTSAVFFRRARNMERKFLTRGAKRSLLLCLCLCLAAHALALNLPSWRAAPRALFPVSKGGKWGFIDGGGHLVIPLRFDSAAELPDRAEELRVREPSVSAEDRVLIPAVQLPRRAEDVLDEIHADTLSLRQETDGRAKLL